MTTCPTCGGEGEEKIYVDLMANSASVNGHSFDLQSQAAEVLYMLKDGLPVRNESLYQALWGLSPDCDWPINPNASLKIAICKLRKYLRGTGYDVQANWGKGYQLVKA